MTTNFSQPQNVPDVSVLIPAYNEEALIGAVIDSVQESFSTLPGVTYEIVVCDNNSTDRTGELAAAKGAVVVKEPHNQIARARNTAAKNARGKWFIFLDGDTLMPAGLLADTVETLETGKVCAGGSVIKFDRENLGLFASFMFRVWNGISVVCRLAAGSYVFCLREAWADTGGFNEEVYAGEELYFSQRLKQWGRTRKLKFKVLSRVPAVTSSRKMDWYGSWQLLLHVLLMARPGAIKRRELCGLWYTRPGADVAPPGP